MSDSVQLDLRRLPKIDRLLEDARAEALIQQHGRLRVVTAFRNVTEAWRVRALAGEPLVAGQDDGLSDLALEEAACWLLESGRRTLRRAINATGVVLHTGLGRAVLAPAALEAALEAGGGHCLLEVDADTGARSNRQEHIAALASELTGAETALAVNNCAAAVLLALTVLAEGREVIISRGQQVEIGGSFRIPDVIRQSGARLVEVGATNKVRLSDYESAITSETALILRVHRSNFRMVGFTEEPTVAELVELGNRHGLPVMDDLGSGALIDLRQYGLTAEPTVQASVEAGASVVVFSGDKLLGGPQAGVMLGKKEFLSRMARHPLMRVVRLDKVTLAALEATLRLYRDESRAVAEIPTLIELTAKPDELRVRAEKLAERLREQGLQVDLEEGISQVGGGSLPGEQLPTTLVAVSPSGGVDDAARRLRMAEPSIWCRIQRDRLLFDVRTVTEDEAEQLAESLPRLLTDAV